MLAAISSILILAVNPHGNLVDETPYQEVLTTFVREARVDYAALKKERGQLDLYLKSVASVTRADFDAAPKDAQIAYLVNAYNAYTLEAIVDHYPIQGGWFGGKNSIKGISGVWDTTTHATALGKVTLDQIEHQNLRTKYGKPAVHMALVCASKGCPPLRAEPYWADTLDAQLEDQAATYLASPFGLVVSGGRVQVSMIFRWFGKDWAATGGWKAWVAARAPEAQRAAVKKALEADDFAWLPYDWSLNDRKGGGP